MAALSVKIASTLKPREGNDYPRMAETASGMLNCVGLQNKGVDYFCEHIYPQIKDIDSRMIVNVSGDCPENYALCAEKIDALENIPAIELNISCPNVKDGGMAFGVTCEGAASVVKAVREKYHKTLIVKLSPNVTNIVDIAKAVGRRSTCLRRRYGAIIVKDKIIISTGYNGAPRGEDNCIDTGMCERERLHVPKGQNYELCVAVHAEQNAIINADPNKMQGATAYIVGYNADGTLASGKPCLLCRRMLRNAMLKKVIYLETDGSVVETTPEEIR